MKWYLTTYFDTSNTSIESTIYSEDEIEAYIDSNDFAILKSKKIIKLIAPINWISEYGISNYTIKEI